MDGLIQLNSAPFPDRVQIHTSDRNTYRRCRRKWYFSSPIRLNMEPSTGQVSPHLWFGSGIHFALEDFHGRKLYATPFAAFQDYLTATKRHLPDDWRELVPLAEGMLNHYIYWESSRQDMHTVWYDPKTLILDRSQISPSYIPACEFNFHVPMGENLFYSGTFDRIVIDDQGRVWILDYKTAQRFNTSKLEMDPQCTAYCWAFYQIFGIECEGVVYIQMLKETPEPPYKLKNGTFSCSKGLNTTYNLYKKALIDEYGNSIARIPHKNLEFADWLRHQETVEGDKFIRRDLVRRSRDHWMSEGGRIAAETAEMLNPQLPLYPNPTRDCYWDCPFRGPCVAMDDGSDWEEILANGYQVREEMHSWRHNLQGPKNVDTDTTDQTAGAFTIQHHPSTA